MKKKKYYIYLVVIILTIVGFASLFFINNVYPFGTRQLSLIDFDTGYIPVYYKLWDVLHLKSSPFVDWNIATGYNIFGSLISNGLISPLSWIIALFPRKTIPFTISYVYLLKMIFVSIMTLIAIRKMFPKAKEKYQVLFTLMYTFSSWTFLMSTNLLYIESFAIFPLLVYSIKELLEKGKWKLYTFLLTLTLLMSYYMAWLDLFFIIGTTGLYLIIMKTDHKADKAVKVLFFTFLSLLLSCILFIPGFMLAKTSTRLANNTSDSGIFDFFMEKAIYLYTLAIPFCLTFKQLTIKKDKRLNIFFICLLFYLLIGVVIEPINALWHTGSHSGFPFRYSYQPTFVLIAISLYYLSKNYKSKENTSWTKMILPIIMFIIIIGIAYFLKDLLIKQDYAVKVSHPICFVILLVIFLLMLLSCFHIFNNSSSKAYILTTILFILTSYIFGAFYVKFLVSETSKYTEDIKEDFSLINDGYYYMSDLEDININYPYILEVGSIANRIHFIRQEFMDQVEALGIHKHNTIIYSSGGNEFNNLLLQNRYYLTKDIKNPDYYELIEDKNGIHYYKNKNALNYILPYNGVDFQEKNKDIFENSNLVYQKLFDGEGSIYTKVDYQYSHKRLSFDVEKGKYYEIFMVYSDLKNYNYSIDEEKIQLYDDSFLRDSAYVSLKAKEDSTFEMKFSDKVKEIYVYSLNQDTFENFIMNHSNNDVTVKTYKNKKVYQYQATEDKDVLLPIVYDDSIKIKVNGKEVKYRCNFYNMLSISVGKGKNTIEITYEQKWFRLGTIISILSTLFLGIIVLINKKYHLLKKKVILYPLLSLSILFFIFFILKVYILSWI